MMSVSECQCRTAPGVSASMSGGFLGESYIRGGNVSAALLERLMNGESGQQTIRVPIAGLIPRQSTDFFAVDDQAVARALNFITHNIHQPFKVPQVVAAARTSRRTLERRFQAVVGRGVQEEVRRLRTERARRLLLDTDLSVKEIAYRSGFSDASQLLQAFRDLLGLSPTAFRQANVIAPNR